MFDKIFLSKEKRLQKERDRETYGTKEWKKDQLSKAYEDSKFKGQLAGARGQGFRAGKQQRHGSGFGGAFQGFSAGMQAFERGGNALIGDVNLGGIGGGLSNGGFEGIGFGGMLNMGRKQKTQRHHKRSPRNRANGSAITINVNTAQNHRKKGRR